MKTNLLVTIMLLCVSFIACRKNTAIDEMKNQPATSEILTGIRTSSQDMEKPYVTAEPVYWRISHILYDNVDVTGNFNTYRFEFLRDQTVVVISKGNTISISGKWSMPDKEHMVMYFDPSPLPLPYHIGFEEFLNGEWTILKSSYFGIYMESDDNKIHRELLFERSF